MIAEIKLSDDECDKLKGKYLTDNSYDTLITDNCDCFREDGSILFKFRKSILTRDECEVGFLAFKNLAKATRGRGASAGPIDPNSVYWKKRTIVGIEKNGWAAQYETTDKDGNKGISKMRVQNEVASNAMGYWSETKNLGLNMPCRLTHYSRSEFLKCEDGQFVIQKISNSYQRLHKEMYDNQMEQSSINSQMTLGDTPFSTVTVNRNFRTAVHKDAGDYGFGNLSVLEYGHYHGGYYVIPKYKIAIDMKKGDHLCVDVHEYHGNTALYETDEDSQKNDLLPDIFKDNLKIGVLGLNNRYARVSLVCYLRDKLKSCTMTLDPKFLTPEINTPTKVRVLFINPLKNSKEREKFYSTNWSRCPSHIEALHRIVKWRMNNMIVINDSEILKTRIPPSKVFIKKDGLTFLNYPGEGDIETGPQNKGVYHYPSSECDTSTCYYCPTWETALKVLLSDKTVMKYYILPQIFK